jgi:hypothetical protein
MTRSHVLAATALLSLLPPSVAAAPPVRAAISRAPTSFEPALSAATPGDRALIAFHFAPIHYQFVDRNGRNGLDGRADFVTRVDFDGDWNARNDWENAAHYPLPGTVYHSVVETKSHWFVVYAFFHPRDWADSLFNTEHENDCEGVLVVARRDGTRFGKLEAAVTIAHSDFYSFVPASGRWSAAAETIDGALELDTNSGERPLTTQEAKGHALKAWRSGDSFDGIVYRPSRIPGPPPTPGDRTASYVLVDVFELGGLWQRRNDADLFVRTGAFAGNDGGGCGSGAVLCTLNAANPPWNWDDTDDGVPRGAIATDPVSLVTRYFRIPEPLSRSYAYNPFLASAPRTRERQRAGSPAPRTK